MMFWEPIAAANIRSDPVAAALPVVTVLDVAVLLFVLSALQPAPPESSTTVAATNAYSVPETFTVMAVAPPEATCPHQISASEPESVLLTFSELKVAPAAVTPLTVSAEGAKIPMATIKLLPTE